MQRYPAGTRLLLWIGYRSRVGVQALYEIGAVRRLVTFLDSRSGKPPIWPR